MQIHAVIGWNVLAANTTCLVALSRQHLPRIIIVWAAAGAIDLNADQQITDFCRA